MQKRKVRMVNWVAGGLLIISWIVICLIYAQDESFFDRGLNVGQLVVSLFGAVGAIGLQVLKKSINKRLWPKILWIGTAVIVIPTILQAFARLPQHSVLARVEVVPRVSRVETRDTGSDGIQVRLSPGGEKLTPPSTGAFYEEGRYSFESPDVLRWNQEATVKASLLDTEVADSVPVRWGWLSLFDVFGQREVELLP